MVNFNLLFKSEIFSLLYAIIIILIRPRPLGYIIGYLYLFKKNIKTIYLLISVILIRFFLKFTHAFTRKNYPFPKKFYIFRYFPKYISIKKTKYY